MQSYVLHREGRCQPLPPSESYTLVLYYRNEFRRRQRGKQHGFMKRGYLILPIPSRVWTSPERRASSENKRNFASFKRSANCFRKLKQGFSGCLRLDEVRIVACESWRNRTVSARDFFTRSALSRHRGCPFPGRIEFHSQLAAAGSFQNRSCLSKHLLVLMTLWNVLPKAPLTIFFIQQKQSQRAQKLMSGCQDLGVGVRREGTANVHGVSHQGKENYLELGPEW